MDFLACLLGASSLGNLLKSKGVTRPSHSVHPPFLLSGEGGDETPTKFSKKEGGGGLTGLQLWEGGCWKRGGNFLSGVVAILQKKKKKFINKNIFLCNN